MTSWTYTNFDRRQLAFFDTAMRGRYVLFVTLRPTCNPHRYLKFLRRTHCMNKATGMVDKIAGNFSRFDFPKMVSKEGK